MPAVQPTKENGTTFGTGPKNSVCLLLVSNGLGDAVHGMPVVWQMVRDGYDVTIYCKAFHAELWRSTGATVRVPEQFELNCTWKKDNASKYARILDFPSWGGWECASGQNIRPQMEQFAELLDAPLPESFSWIDILKPEIMKDGPYILFAPDSTEIWRTLPRFKAQELFDELEQGHEVIWLTQNAQGYTLNDLVYPSHKCDSFEELLSLVYNAEHVVSVESGISNLAGALGKPLTVIAGVTTTEQIIGQYDRYIPGYEYTEVRSDMGMRCNAPCWRNAERGFVKAKCLGQYDIPQCLTEISVESIVDSLPVLQLN